MLGIRQSQNCHSDHSRVIIYTPLQHSRVMIYTPLQQPLSSALQAHPHEHLMIVYFDALMTTSPVPAEQPPVTARPLAARKTAHHIRSVSILLPQTLLTGLSLDTDGPYPQHQEADT
jgi:hypothetical protein